MSESTQESKSTTRDGFGIGLKEAGQKNKNVFALCADLTESTRVTLFKEACPDRYLEMGVAEENMVGVATGLALSGKIPVAVSYAVFIVNNALGPIRVSVCYSNANVKLVGGHAGLSTGPDGATHQALEDIAIMRSLPNMTVLVPCDKEEARKATHAMITHTGPVYLRTSKFPTAEVTTATSPFNIGVANILRDGSDVTIIACGTMVEQALEAAQLLEKQKISARVVNMHTIKPIDRNTISKAAAETKAILTIEEHQQYGGLGSAVAEVLATLPQRPAFTSLAMPDVFGESGDGLELLDKYGLTAKHIVAAALALL
jgi:transketolase